MTFELNNVRRDSDTVFNGNEITKYSPVVEVFSAMVNGESLEKFGKKADVAVNYIKGLGNRANNGDFNAISELNTIRRFVIEAPVMEEMKLLGIFGSYKNVGFDETIEREVYKHVGDFARAQANNGDVVFPAIVKDTYQVPTFTISGGYEVDYRRVELGDMSKENEGMAMVRTSILNQAKLAVITKVYNAIANATGVKYVYSASGLAKAGVDGVIGAVRRNGPTTVVGDYAIISQFSPWAGYAAANASPSVNITGISEKVMNEIQANGVLSSYNGVTLTTIDNPYNLYDATGTWTDGTNTGANYKPLFPANIAFVIPRGVESPIATWTRGGLTSLTGTDVKTGKFVTRYDLEVAVDCARGMEWKLGLIRDSSIAGI